MNKEQIIQKAKNYKRAIFVVYDQKGEKLERTENVEDFANTLDLYEDQNLYIEIRSPRGNTSIPTGKYILPAVQVAPEPTLHGPQNNNFAGGDSSALRWVNGRLERENAKLENQNERLIAQVEKLKEENASLKLDVAFKDREKQSELAGLEAEQKNWLNQALENPTVQNIVEKLADGYIMQKAQQMGQATEPRQQLAATDDVQKQHIINVVSDFIVSTDSDEALNLLYLVQGAAQTPGMFSNMVNDIKNR